MGDAAVVEELLKAGANVHAKSFDGVTPLHDAVTFGHCQVMKKSDPFLRKYTCHTS